MPNNLSPKISIARQAFVQKPDLLESANCAAVTVELATMPPYLVAIDILTSA
jgi:hypothetical protein